VDLAGRIVQMGFLSMDRHTIIIKRSDRTLRSMPSLSFLKHAVAFGYLASNVSKNTLKSLVQELLTTDMSLSYQRHGLAVSLSLYGTVGHHGPRETFTLWMCALPGAQIKKRTGNIPGRFCLTDYCQG